MLRNKIYKNLVTTLTCLAVIASLALPGTAEARVDVTELSLQLSAIVADGPQVNLNWSLSDSSSVSGFEIARSQDPLTGYSNIYNAGRSDRSFVDHSAMDGQAYYYKVRAYKKSSFSAYSNVEFADIPALEPQEPVDAESPSVSLINPADNTVFTNEQTVSLDADAIDDIGVDRVDFYCDDILLGSDVTAPYAYSWAISQANNGQRILKAKAYDVAGKEGVSVSKTVTVDIATVATPVPGTFEFTASSYSVDEGAGVVNVTINRSGGSDGVATVDWRTIGVSATYDADYSSFSWSTLTFADGETSKIKQIAIVSDSEVEEDETFNVLLDNPTGGATLGATTASLVTILDDDVAVPVPGAFEFTASSYSVDEGAGVVNVTINRSGGSDGVATVDWRTQSVTATFDADYGSFTWQTLSFADGETSKTKQIVIVSDSEVEEDETFNVLLDNPTGGTTLGATATSLTTILDDDVAVPEPGTFEFAASSYSVDEGAGVVNVTINRFGGSDGVATIDWRTTGVSATYDADYSSFSWTTLTFADGETSKTKSIAIVSDDIAEEDEVFNLSLANPTGGASLGALETSSVTILDDDIATTDPTPAPDLGYLPVFPGAVGFGTETPAGRGGQIIKVTNLNDSGAGSLREAIAATGPRIIVFEVSGTISLSEDLRIYNPFITIAGQTAPSPGITLKGAGIRVYSNDVLLQHLRIRIGDEPSIIPPESRDAIQIIGNNRAYNVVIDHISASWAIDENVSTWYELHDVTISNSIISEALDSPLHPKGPHSKGLLIGDYSTNISVVGNVLSHNVERNARINGAASVVVANNLMYNQSSNSAWTSIGYTSGPSVVSVQGNMYINGPDTPSSPSAIELLYYAPSGSKVYEVDNQHITGAIFTNSTGYDPLVYSPPISHPSITVHESSNVEALVLANAGARPADRDSVDARVINETATRTGSIIASQKDVGGWPTLAANNRSFNIPANPNGDDDGDGYTNIEEVLHQMAAIVEGR